MTPPFKISRSATDLDEYILQYLFNKKQRISKENAVPMNITHFVN